MRRFAGSYTPVLALTALAALLAGCEPPPSEPDPSEASGGTAGAARRADLGSLLGDGRWIDLTHPFSEETVYWPTARPFELDTVAWGRTEAGYFYSAFEFSAAEHGGTHLDAPVHFAEGAPSVDEIPLDRLIAPAVVVDVSRQSTTDYRIAVEDLTAWEAEHGRVPDGAVLLFRTGWGERYGDRAAYLGTDLTGPEAVPELHFPGIHPETARWLVENRAPAAVGIDTPSIDYGQSTEFESHVVLYSAGIPGFENVASLDALPETGSTVFALPMKIEGGSGAPLRIVAFVPSSSDRRP